MKIEKVSKCIWLINEERIDSRNAPTAPTVSKYDGLRGALMVYLATRNPRIKLAKIDERVCRFMNRNLCKLKPLIYSCVFCR